MGFKSSAVKEQNSWAVVAVAMLLDLTSLLAFMSCPPHHGAAHCGFSLLQLTPMCAPCSLPQGHCARSSRSCGSCCMKMPSAGECLSVSMKAATSNLFHNLPQGIKLISILFTLGGCFTEEEKEKTSGVFPHTS